MRHYTHSLILVNPTNVFPTPSDGRALSVSLGHLAQYTDLFGRPLVGIEDGTLTLQKQIAQVLLRKK